MMRSTNATDVRREWGSFIDKVVRDRPQAIKRSRDHILAMSMEHAQELVKDVRFTLEYEEEPDGSVSGSLKELDLVENAPTVEALKEALAEELMVYAEGYFDEFQLYFHAPNRKKHFPFVLRVLLSDHPSEITELIHAKPART
jgi:uncharacterized protein YbcC (UPF0753/DUF2309 family)